MTDREGKPYFASEEPPEGADQGVQGVILAGFLNRLSGAASISLDPRQELLVMLLQARCLKYALSPQLDEIVTTINQLCAIYQQGTLRMPQKAFDVFFAMQDEYIPIQEQVHWSGEQASDRDQASVSRTNNLLNHCHELMENFLRKISTFGYFALDAIESSSNAGLLSPAQYVDEGLSQKEKHFADSPSILMTTHAILFGGVERRVRNSIAHRRYRIDEDGTARLFDYNPRTRQRDNVGEMSQVAIEQLVRDLEMGVDTFEISNLIFQHNHGEIMAQLGYVADGDREYTDKEITERLFLEASTSYLQAKKVSFEGNVVRADIQTAFPAVVGQEPSTVYVNTKDKDGNAVRYAVSVPSVDVSARDQTLRFMQKAALYCGSYESIHVRTADNEGNLIGEAAASVESLKRSSEKPNSLEGFLNELSLNTFSQE